MIDDREISKGVTTLTVTWGAMLGAVALYIFVIPRFVGRFTVPAMAEGPYRILRAALFALAVILLAVSRYLPRLVVAGRGLKAPPGGAMRHPALQRYATSRVVALSLAEAVALFGLVLFVVGRDTASLYALGGVSVLAMVLHRPTREGLTDAVALFEDQARRAGRGRTAP